MNLSIKPGRFYRWLKRQSKRDDVIGDFARDAIQDWRFPAGANSKEEIRVFLKDRMWYGGYDDAAGTLTEAWGEFTPCKRSRDGLSSSLRFRILKRDGYQCCLCGRSAPGVVLEVDHRIPVSKGGTNDESNLMTLCFDCNRGKGTNDL